MNGARAGWRLAVSGRTADRMGKEGTGVSSAKARLGGLAKGNARPFRRDCRDGHLTGGLTWTGCPPMSHDQQGRDH